MTKAIKKRPLLLAAFTALVVLALAPSASAATAPGSLKCPTLSQYNNTHYGLGVGETVTCTIEGASDVADGPGVEVIIKSNALGNTTVTGSAAGGVITFTFTAPSNGCDTSIVAYKTSGNNSNNDFIDDGVKNGTGTSAGGLAYLTQGQVRPCAPTAVTFQRFVADRTARGVRVRWSTASESGTIGFNVYREVAGQRVKLNSSLVRASLGLQGHAYSLLDRRGAKGSRYWIQAVERNGARAWYGSATAR